MRALRSFHLSMFASSLVLSGWALAPAVAQEEAVKEVVVTGSFIRQSPEDAPVPIQAFSKLSVSGL